MPVTRLIAVLALGLLAACSQPARVNEMAVFTTGGEALASERAPALAQAVTIGTIEGGSITTGVNPSQVDNEALRGALELTMVSHRIYAAPSQARYRLSGILQELRQPFFAFDMTVTSNILWTMVEAASGTAVWQDLVVTPHTARLGEALLGVERLRVANEGSIKANLTELMRRLANFRPGAPVAPTAPLAPPSS